MTLPASDPNEFPMLLYKGDMARVLRRSERSVDRLDRAGKLPARLPLNGRPCWSRDQVLAWLNGKGRR